MAFTKSRPVSLGPRFSNSVVDDVGSDPQPPRTRARIGSRSRNGERGIGGTEVEGRVGGNGLGLRKKLYVGELKIGEVLKSLFIPFVCLPKAGGKGGGDWKN